MDCAVSVRYIALYKGRQEAVIHIGVGSNVVCSTKIGNARASVRGADNEDVPRFFYASIMGYFLK